MQACDRLIDNHATELSPHEIVREASQQRAQHIEIGIGPIRKDAIRQPFSRGIQQGDHLAAPFADGGFTHALVVQRGAPLNEARRSSRFVIWRLIVVWSRPVRSASSTTPIGP